ncbi:hypothetical protein [Acinetobacter sp. SwsAc6]|uniref:hypothetical protein n=1 Tax=Acinetobacter sp. SwsAc6 TaxID=2749439 RepID=UPI001C4DB1BE
MDIQKQVAFEKFHARDCNCDYEDLKRRLDRHELLTGHRYPPTSPRHEAWLTWCAAWDAKAQAVPEGFVLVKKVHPDAIVHNQGLGLFKECQVIYGWDGKSKDFKDALNKGFYHGVKLGAKAVLETTMIEAQEQGND